jgi:hypothetical protein
LARSGGELFLELKLVGDDEAGFEAGFKIIVLDKRKEIIFVVGYKRNKNCLKE